MNNKTKNPDFLTQVVAGGVVFLIFLLIFTSFGLIIGITGVPIISVVSLVAYMLFSLTSVYLYNKSIRAIYNRFGAYLPLFSLGILTMAISIILIFKISVNNDNKMFLLFLMLIVVMFFVAVQRSYIQLAKDISKNHVLGEIILDKNMVFWKPKFNKQAVESFNIKNLLFRPLVLIGPSIVGALLVNLFGELSTIVVVLGLSTMLGFAFMYVASLAFIRSLLELRYFEKKYGKELLIYKALKYE